jgi:hypothetical protein
VGRGAVAADGALRFHVQRVQRLAGGHEQAVAVNAAEAEVGAALRQVNAQHHRAVRIEHHDTVLGLAAAPPAPQVALDVAAEAVGDAGAAVHEDTLVGQRVAGHVEDVDQARAGAALDHVEA